MGVGVSVIIGISVSPISGFNLCPSPTSLRFSDGVGDPGVIWGAVGVNTRNEIVDVTCSSGGGESVAVGLGRGAWQAVAVRIVSMKSVVFCGLCLLGGMFICIGYAHFIQKHNIINNPFILKTL